MSISRVSVGSLAAAAATSVSVTLPSHQTNDLIIVVGGGREDSPADSLAVSGYTAIGSQAFLDLGSNAITLHAWYKFATSGSESNPTITGAGSATGGTFGFAVVYRGVNQTTPLSGVTPLQGTSAAAATYTPPSITPDSAIERTVISIVATPDDNNLSATTAQGFTTVAGGTSYNTTTGLDIAFCFAEKAVTQSSAVTLPTYTENANGNDAWAYKSFVLRPAAISGVASFSAQSTLTAVGRQKFQGAASFSAQSTLTAVGRQTFKAAASFSSQSTLTANGTASAVTTYYGIASFSGQSSLTANGTAITQEIEYFEGGTDPSDYTTSSGIADGGSGTGTAVRTSEARVTGSKGGRFTFTTGNLISREIQLMGSPSDTVCWSRMVVKAPVPSAAYTISQIRDSSTALVVLRINANGTISIRDNATTRGTTTYAVNGTDFIQISWGFSGGLVRLRIYDMQGNLIESEKSGTYSGTTTPAWLYFGVQTTPTTSPYVVDIDEVGYNTAKEITPLVIQYGDTSFSSESSLTANGTRKAVASSTLSSESSLTANGTVTTGSTTHYGIAAFSSESSLTANGSRKAVASASFSAQSTLTANGSRKAVASASFSAQSTLTANGSRKAVAAASFSA